ncbi:SufD family Fe-S cluster assembly protein [Candidatus Babeliales bacterium]|nr:SufD family Fe-S cluster assembly protein [Candidatus Babeliales bacterium]
MNYLSLFFLPHTQIIACDQTIYHQVAQLHDSIFLKIQNHVQLKLYLLDTFELSEKKIIKYHILLKKEAQLNFFMGVVDAHDVQIEIYLYLHGDSSSADIFGVYALDQQQKFLIKTYQNHYGIGTKSNLVLHGMLKDQAQADVQGLIFIDKQACKTEASQENKNIVMGSLARVVSEPSIEVLNHDVECSHGTAIGQFNQQHRWYLQSRGFDVTSANQMLIQSFFGSVVQKFEKGSEFMEILCKKMI